MPTLRHQRTVDYHGYDRTEKWKVDADTDDISFSVKQHVKKDGYSQWTDWRNVAPNNVPRDVVQEIESRLMGALEVLQEGRTDGT